MVQIPGSCPSLNAWAIASRTRRITAKQICQEDETGSISDPTEIEEIDLEMGF